MAATPPRAADQALQAPGGQASLLEVRSLSAGYGRRTVVRDISLKVGSEEIVVLLGHNGAGKTTILRSIAGLVPCSGGSVRLGDVDVTRKSAAATAAAGIALVPQGRGIFTSLTIEENLALGSALAKRRRGSDGAGDRDLVNELFPLFKQRSGVRAGSLSGGERQMVAIAMALMAHPRVLLLDEPSTGLAPVLVEEVLSSVRRINKMTGTSVLLVEQDIARVLEVADRVYVVKLGSIILEDTVDQFVTQDWTQLF